MKRKASAPPIAGSVFDSNGGFLDDPLTTHQNELQLLMVQFLGHALALDYLLELRCMKTF